MKSSVTTRLRRWFANVALRAYYAAADVGRRNQHWGAASANPNRPINAEWPTITARIRDLKRNNPIIKGALRNLGTIILPEPIRVEPNVCYARSGKTIPGINDQLESLWDSWCLDGADYDAWDSHAMTFNEIIAMANNILSSDGEVFIIFREASNDKGLPPVRLELAERDRLGPVPHSLPSRVDGRSGLVYDDNNNIIAYEFLKDLSSGSLEYERIPASDVLHVMIPDRPQMDTGDLALACVLTSISDLGEFISNELEIKAIMSRIAGVYTGIVPGTEENPNSAVDPFKLLNVGKASIWQLPEGQFSEMKLDRPGSGFQEFVNVSLRFIAVGLGVPFEAVSADFSQTNFSSSRMSWLQHHPTITSRRDLLVNQIIRNVYRRVMSAARLSGLTPAFPMGINSFDAAIYRKPGYRYIDPEKEIAAERAAMEAGIKSPQMVCAEHGQDYFQVIAEIAEAKKFAEERGVTLAYGSKPPAPAAAPATDTAPRFVRPVPDSLLPAAANGNGKAHHG